MISEVYLGDCLEWLPHVKDKGVDMILCDLPYGTTACSWDTIIPFEPLWKEYKRVIKDCGAIVLTASQPFTSMLVMSNIDMFRYEWIWKKNRTVGFTYCKTQPLRNIENILVFIKDKYGFNQNEEGRKYFDKLQKHINKTIGEINKIMGNRHAEHCFYITSQQFNLPTKETYKKLTEIFNLRSWSDYIPFDGFSKGEGISNWNPTFNHQGLIKKKISKKIHKKNTGKEWVYSTKGLTGKDYEVEFENYPTQFLEFDCEINCIHPTQKPLDLFRYLIRTYTNKGDTVMDNCLGSGTTRIACAMEGRNFIGCEKDKRFYDMQEKRYKDFIAQTTIDL